MTLLDVPTASAPAPSPAAPARRCDTPPPMHAVRGPDAAGRVLPRLPELRQHERLQLNTTHAT